MERPGLSQRRAEPVESKQVERPGLGQQTEPGEGQPGGEARAEPAERAEPGESQASGELNQERAEHQLMPAGESCRLAPAGETWELSQQRAAAGESCRPAPAEET